MSTHHTHAAPRTPRSTGRAAATHGAAPRPAPQIHHNAHRLPRCTPWTRWLALAAVAALVLGTLVWMTQQSRTLSSAQDLVGRTAPAATLRLASSAGHDVSLAQYRGKKVVLYFYEGSTCGSCQQQLSLLQTSIASRRDTVVLAASVDPAATSRLLAQQLGLSYPILADSDHQLGTAFHDFHLVTAGMDMGPVDNHAIFVLDAQGTVRWVRLAADTMWVPVADITAALEKA